MQSKNYNAAKKALTYYKQALSGLKKKIDSQGKLEFLTLGEILDSRGEARMICKKMGEDGIDTKPMAEKIMPLDKLFKELIDRVGKKQYLAELESRLKQRIESYEYSIKHKMYEELHEFEFDLNTRDTIETMRCEIENEWALDNTLKKKLRESDRKFKTVVIKLSKKFNIKNAPWYPKSFWWRHLKETK